MIEVGGELKRIANIRRRCFCNYNSIGFYLISSTYISKQIYSLVLTIVSRNILEPDLELAYPTGFREKAN